MKRRISLAFAAAGAVAAMAAPTAMGDSLKVCTTGDEPNPKWTTTQKGSCQSSHDPSTANPGGNPAPGQNR